MQDKKITQMFVNFEYFKHVIFQKDFLFTYQKVFHFISQKI